MTLAVLVLIGLIVVLLLGGIILGLFTVGAGDKQSRNTFSARQDWMNSHVEENE
jgi:hypothetical protein